MSIYYFIQQNMFPDVRSIYHIVPSKIPTEYVRGISNKKSSDHDTESYYDIHSNHQYFDNNNDNDHDHDDDNNHHYGDNDDIYRFDQHRSTSSHMYSTRKYSRISSIESDNINTNNYHNRHDISIDTFQTAFASPTSPPHLNLPTNSTPTFSTSQNFHNLHNSHHHHQNHHHQQQHSTSSYRSPISHHSSEQYYTRNLSKSSYHTTHQDIQDIPEFNNNNNCFDFENHEVEILEDEHEHCQESLNSEFIHTESFSSSCRDSLHSYGKNSHSHSQESRSLLHPHSSSNNTSSSSLAASDQQKKKELLKKYNSGYNDCKIM